jgi:hypothetical protein
MDENVHGAITIGLRLRGVDVLTVQEDGRWSMVDGREHLTYAISNYT